MNNIRIATFADGVEVAKHIRDDDRREVEGLGQSPALIPFWLLTGEHPTAFFSDEGKIAGAAGIHREENNVGRIWMLCTDVIHDQPIKFVRQAKSWLRSVEPDYSLLWNLADARNHTHQKLLKHLGFKAIRSIAYGKDQLIYNEIVKLCAYQQPQQRV